MSSPSPSTSRLAPAETQGAALNDTASIEDTEAHAIRVLLVDDHDLFRTGLRNLLDNALKSCVAAKSGSIRVEATRAAGAIVLAVSDDGLGFPPEDALMIFEKFHRLGDELRRATPGTGLGLYIVKRLVELSGGAVHAESAGPGRGATVSMSWPVGAAR